MGARSQATQTLALAGALLLLGLVTAVCCRAAEAPAPAAPFTLVPDPTPVSLPASAHVVDVADVTGSGVPDLILVNAQENAVGVMLGNGSGGFSEVSWLSVEGKPSFVAVADFNGDAHPDLVVPMQTITPAIPYPNSLPDKLELFFGDGHGGFAAGTKMTLPEIGPVYAGRFTGSSEDLVVAPDGCWGRDNADKYYMLLNDGYGNLSKGPVSEVQGESGCAKQVGDFTGDGRDDLLNVNFGHVGEQPSIEVLPGQEDGHLGAPITTSAPALAGLPSIAAITDLNGDGRPDLITTVVGQGASRVAVLDGNGAGGFSEGSSYPSELNETFGFGVLLGEFGGEHRTDLLASGPTQLILREEQAGGTFGSPLALPKPLIPGQFWVTDVNGDGRSDIVDASSSSFQIYLGEPAVAPPSSPAPAVPTIADLRQSASRWREGRALARIGSGRAHPLPTGSTFAFTLSAAAKVKLTFMQHVRGSRSAGRCATGRGRRRDRGSCSLLVRRGTLSYSGREGPQRVRFEGWLSRSQLLPAGSYTLELSAHDAAGSATPQRLGFTIVG